MEKILLSTTPDCRGNDLYADDLSVTFGYATATGLSNMLDGSISHEAISRFLSEREYTSKDLWKQVKGLVRAVETDDGVLIIDDTVEEKPHMDENDLICWHYDHCQGCKVTGINLLNCRYHGEGVSIPVAFERVRKPIRYCEIATRKEKRCSEATKHEPMRGMVDACLQHQWTFSRMLTDIWCASSGNMGHVKQTRHQDFIMALTSNRLVALGKDDRKKNRHTRLDQLEWPEQEAITGWLKGLNFPVRLARQAFKNKDGSEGVLYLACSKLEPDYPPNAAKF